MGIHAEMDGYKPKLKALRTTCQLSAAGDLLMDVFISWQLAHSLIRVETVFQLLSNDGAIFVEATNEVEPHFRTTVVSKPFGLGNPMINIACRIFTVRNPHPDLDLLGNETSFARVFAHWLLD